MDILILTEPIADGRFRARAGEPIALTAEGNTREEATQHLEALLHDRLRGGGQLAVIRIENGSPLPPSQFQPAPLPADDWAFRTMREAIAENRRREDETAG
jgi:hypothetical protein